MANKLQVQIQETVEELEHRLEGHATAVNKEKLLVLYPTFRRCGWIFFISCEKWEPKSFSV